MSGINWAVELKKIEREVDGLPPEPSPGALKARRAAELRAQQQQEARTAALGAWARLLLVMSLAVGLWFWPYARECGAGLFAYLGVEVLIATGALWVVSWTWRHRMPKTHGLSLLMVLLALVLIGIQALPRVGYAKVDSAHPPQWRCSAAPLRG
jgi:hypothetical protein